MASPDLAVIDIDLSNGPYTDSPFQLNGQFQRFTFFRKDQNITIRFAQGGAKVEIRNEGQLVDLGCDDQGNPITVDKIFVTSDPGSGFVKLFASTKAQVVFSGAGEGAEVRHPNAHFTVGAKSLANQNPENLLNAFEDMTNASTGDEDRNTTFDNTLGVNGIRLRINAGINANSRVGYFEPNRHPALLTILGSGTATKNFGRDFYLHAYGLNLVEEIVAASTTDTSMAFWGWGRLEAPGSAFDGNQIGFIADQTGANWYAHFYSDADGQIVKVDTGKPWDEVSMLELRIGWEGTTPYIRWYVNGEQVHEITGFQAFTLNADNFEDFFFMFGCLRTLGNSSDTVTLWTLMGDGCHIDSVYPNGF